MVTKCSHYGDGCKECKCAFVDKAKYIQDLVDYDEARIATGWVLFGKVVSLSDGQIQRIYSALQRRVDFIRSGLPLCQNFDFTEGKHRDMLLYPNMA